MKRSSARSNTACPFSSVFFSPRSTSWPARLSVSSASRLWKVWSGYRSNANNAGLNSSRAFTRRSAAAKPKSVASVARAVTFSGAIQPASFTPSKTNSIFIRSGWKSSTRNNTRPISMAWSGSGFKESVAR